MDGLGRLKDGLIDGLGLGETDLARLDMRSGIPPLGALALGADWAIGEGPRLIRGLGEEPKDRDPIDPPGLVTEGREGICGADGALGAALLMLGREAIPPAPLRPRIWPCACGPTNRAIPSTTAAIEETHTRRFGRTNPAAREWFLSSTANIVKLLSPRR